MAKEGGPDWKGLLKWSLSHVDGTNSSPTLSATDRKWFLEAMQAHTVDVIKRMKEITFIMKVPEQALESEGVTPQEIEDMLDELQEHVEPIDMANDLHSIGGLVLLLRYLKSPHANIRAKAAEVVSTIVQNNPNSQLSVMKVKGLEPLFSNFTSDPDVVVRTKALGAISSLIRHNRSGIAAFRLANGFAALKDALLSENVRFQRKALNLIHYLLTENESDCGAVTELGFPRIFMQLASSEDADVREASLRVLLELAHYKLRKPVGTSREEVARLKQILKGRIDRISQMSAEDLGAATEESLLVDSLWNIYCNEPSSLVEKGLIVLPGEDAPPPPDVVSQNFQPPLRTWAANRSRDAKPKKKVIPLLLGPGPSADNAP